VDFRISEWISGFQIGFLDFRVDFWISIGFLDFNWISGFQIGFLPTVYEISDPSITSSLVPRPHPRSGELRVGSGRARDYIASCVRMYFYGIGKQ